VRRPEVNAYFRLLLINQLKHCFMKNKLFTAVCLGLAILACNKEKNVISPAVKSGSVATHAVAKFADTADRENSQYISVEVATCPAACLLGAVLTRALLHATLARTIAPTIIVLANCDFIFSFAAEMTSAGGIKLDGYFLGLLSILCAKRLMLIISH